MNKIDKYLILLKDKDSYTYHHSKRVAYYSFLIGKFLDFNNSEMLNLILSALLHDIGKLYIPNEILNKKGMLTDEEYDIIKHHTTYAKIILDDNFPDIINDIVCHHERLDGSGYPNHIKELSINAKIIAIVDSFDAMTSNRNYNNVKSFEEAFDDLFCNHNLYDIELVKIFYKVLWDNFKYKKYYKTRH